MAHRRGSRSTGTARQLSTPQKVFMGLLGALAVFLIWLVSTTSLPFALAPVNPDLALKLNPSNPQALLTKADRARSRLLELVTQDITAARKRQAPGAQPTDQGAADSSSANPDRQSDAAADERRAAEREALTDQIRSLAGRVIANDPLNARAYRLAGEVSDDRAGIKAKMRQAARRSRRESVAQFWLLDDAFRGGKFATALSHADILLRTRPQLAKLVMSYLMQIIDDPKGRPLVTKKLAANPNWRGAFLAALAQRTGGAPAPLDLLIALKNTNKPLSAKELTPFLIAMIRTGQVETAYNVWLQFLPEKELARLGFIFNPGFERSPSGLPFDWRINIPMNAIVEISPLAQEGSNQQALHVLMGPGRVQRLETSQTIILVAGRYELSVKVRGKLRAKRGLRWRLRCLYGAREIIGQSQMIIGVMPRWRTVNFSVTVPAGPSCRAQTIALIHDSRSASEDFISGGVWFDDLTISRAAN